jgi:beta-lactam-binding protein with PASTA domain
MVLLATTLAATRQQDTTAAARAARAARARAAAARLDTAAARIRARTAIPPTQTTGGRTQDGPAVTMPKLIGLDTLSAIRLLRSRKMLPYVILPPARGLVARDEIAAQDPTPDAPYTYRTLIRLTLDGREPPQDLVTVPSVVGLPRNEAERELERRRLGTDMSEEPVTSLDSIGRVVRQKPDSGERVPPGSRVAISLGRDARIAMPRVTGLTLAVARQTLRDAGFTSKPRERRIDGDGEPMDSVIGQSPETGTMVSADALVVLQLGRAPISEQPPIEVPPPIAVPALVGMDSASAIRALADVGLRNYVVQSSSAATVDSVDAQSPAAGALVPPQTTIVLTMRARIAVVVPPSRRYPLIALVGLLLVAAVAAGYAARMIWPAPTITPSARVQPGVAELSGFTGNLVEVSVSFRSHVEHEPSEMELTSAPLS